MNAYAELMQRQQNEFNALPLGFAFSQTQFDEMMQSWGLHPERDLKMICSIGYGGYIQKKDVELLHQMSMRHRAEKASAIAGDKTGDGFILQMFYHELINHEYSYTCDAHDALNKLGYTLEQVQADSRLSRGFEMACKEIMRREG